MKNSKNKLALAVMASVLSCQASASELFLEEVVVTAQKKSESLMDVPVTVTSISGETLDNISGFDLSDLSKATSGLRVTTKGNTPNIALRGVDSGLSSAGTGQRVTTYFNGSYMANQGEFWLANYDMERVEILRGPQGTLYGASSPTGAIVAYPKKPSLSDSDGFVRQSFGQHNLSNTQFAYGAPIIEDELAIRIAGSHDRNNSDDASYLDGPDFLSRTESGRVSLLWAPTDTFDADLVHAYSERYSNDATYSRGNGVNATDRVSASAIEGQRDHLINTTVLSMNWDLDFAELTSQSFYSETAGRITGDGDNTPSGLETADSSIDVRTYNQEFRLSSLGNESWDWVLGVYHSKSDSTIDTDTSLYELGAQPIANNVYSIYALTTDFNTIATSQGEANAIFTHNTFYLTEAWSVIAGLRWNKTETHTVIDNYAEVSLDAGAGPNVLGGAGDRPVDEAAKNIFWTGTVKVKYTTSENANIYFTYDRGVRTGAGHSDYVGTTGRNAPELLTFETEYANSYELGYKASLLDNRLNLSSALFYTSYKDFQLGASATFNDGTSDGVRLGFTDNVPEVTTEGLDLEVTYLAAENLLLNAAVTYTRSKFADYADAPVVQEGVDGIPVGEIALQDLTGVDVGGMSGRWSITMSANYSQDIALFDSEWYTSALMNYTGARTSPFDGTKTGGYSSVDFSTGLRTENWDLRLWVKNAFNKQTTLKPSQGGNGPGVEVPAELSVGDIVIDNTAPALVRDSGYYNVSNYNSPRQVGITASYNF